MFIICNNKKVYIDKDGYLVKNTDWNENIAIKLALLENIKLTKKHWKVIYFLRYFYIKYNVLPTMRILTKYVKNMNSYNFILLFPNEQINQAAKISGLPNLSKCI
ncbi:MAG: TusE/DsrC/DsvC family sulfur relay protein [Enterobacterales bacterium]